MSIILTLSDATTNKTYIPRGMNGYKEEFVDADSPLDERATLMTDHQIKTGVNQTSRHILSAKKVLQNSEGSQSAAIIASLSITVPNLDTVTSTAINDVIKQVQCLLGNSSVNKLVAGASLDGIDASQTSFVPN